MYVNTWISTQAILSTCLLACTCLIGMQSASADVHLRIFLSNLPVGCTHVSPHIQIGDPAQNLQNRFIRPGYEGLSIISNPDSWISKNPKSFLLRKFIVGFPKILEVLELGSADCLEFWRYLVVRSAHGKPTSTTCPSSTAHSGSYRSLSSACLCSYKSCICTHIFCISVLFQFVFMRTCIYVCMYVYIHTQKCVRMNIHVYIHIDVRVDGVLQHHVAEYVFLCLSIYARACVDRRCVYAGDVCLRQCSYASMHLYM